MHECCREYVPLMAIFPQVRPKEEFSIGLPLESIVACLIIMDCHKTRTQNVHMIQEARGHCVIILCLPSHRIQTLNVSFMTPLSKFYSQEVEAFLMNNPCRVITIYQMGRLFWKALKAANSDVFTDDMFIAADPTDQPENEPPSTEEDSPEREQPFPIRH